MESRVLVVSLFAPYSVNFDQPAENGTPPGNAMQAADRHMRSGSTGRNSVWKGRRSSVHRTHTTPLGHHGQPHSRRRSSFSVNAFKLTPISRSGSADRKEPGESPPNGDAARLAPHAEHDEQPHVRRLDPTQLGFSIDEAAGAHTPPANTLDYSRKATRDLMREKQARRSGMHGSPAKRKTAGRTAQSATLASAAEEVAASQRGLVGSRLDGGVPKSNGNTNGHADPALTASLVGLNISTTRSSNGSDVSSMASPGDMPWSPSVVPGTRDEFVVEHLNVGNIGLFNSVNASLDQFAERIWIGEIGVTTDSWSEERKAAVSSRLLDEFETVPVFVSDKEFEGHYSRFCKQLLWPAFHYIMPEMPHWHGWEKSAYEAALSTCQKFADRIVEIYREGDVIWVNDYHLMLLPKLIRERLPHAKVGFFLHIPFPSSEIFRCLHVRKELLEGMLGADVVGLQTFSYKRHFIQTAKRVLGVEGSPSGLFLDKGPVVVGQYAMGLDPASVEEKWSNVAVGDLIQFLKEKYAGKYLIVGRDKLDYVKGVRQKLLGYEMFLNDHPEYASKTVFIQIALTTAEHNELHVQVMDVVNRINSKFGNIEHQPVVFFHKDIPYTHYLALLSTADAMMVMSLRDGMNLTSHEFVLCQREKHSPLILSEFVGTYGAFSGGALGVNPMDTRAISNAINDALVMSEEEKLDRWEILYRQVYNNSARSFVSSFVSDLASTRREPLDEADE
ncbi:Trehalose-6-P synthase/phosphatase complex subunit [Linderina pennispora]|nr:Trehalose-6-P synthase/phosphatase complex subunit [Linderina pennispora]